MTELELAMSKVTISEMTTDDVCNAVATVLGETDSYSYEQAVQFIKMADVTGGSLKEIISKPVVRINHFLCIRIWKNYSVHKWLYDIFIAIVIHYKI